jgi:cbb3-type cytochrome oxidase maturation protein
VSLILVACGCWAFFWAVDSGQFDDLDSPGWDAAAQGSCEWDAAHGYARVPVDPSEAVTRIDVAPRVPRPMS